MNHIKSYKLFENLDDYSLSIKKVDDDYYVVASLEDNIIGKLSFIKSKYKSNLISTSIVVQPNYQRKGIASAMYNFAENELDMKFIRNDDVLTPDGKKFWDNRKS